MQSKASCMPHKRRFQDADSENTAAEETRHCTSLQSVVLEAVKANAMQNFWVVLEPMLRRVVSEEVERVLAKYLNSTKLGSRLPSKQFERWEPSSLRLQFQNKLALPLYTGRKVEGEHGSSIRVSLQDASTGKVVVMDDESAMKLDIVVLEGDFPDDEEGDWSYEEFENHVVKEREGRRPLLTGNLSIFLKDGTGILGELNFTDNSSWIRSRKFRIGVRLSTGFINGKRVREAKTEAFFVKDHRGQLYKKHYPPKLSDDVWRLEKIGKDGAYHKRLCEYHVYTVEDFLIMHATGPSRLREIFGSTMPAKTWDSILEHAKTCTLDDTQRVYYPDDSHTIGVVLNSIYQPLGILRNGSYVASSSLSDSEQVYMDRLVEEAYNDLSSLHKLPSRANFQELDVATRCGSSCRVYNGSLQTEAPEMQQFQAQKNAHLSYESSSATFAPGCVPNMSQSDTATSMIGLGIKPSLFANTFSPGTLESLFACRNHYPKEAEVMVEDPVFYQSLSRYGDDCINGKVFEQLGNDELLMLPGLSTGSFLNATMPAFPRLLNTNNLDVNQGRLHGRACMSWRKLKVVLKCSCVMKNVIASRRKFQIEQLN